MDTEVIISEGSKVEMFKDNIFDIRRKKMMLDYSLSKS